MGKVAWITSLNHVHTKILAIEWRHYRRSSSIFIVVFMLRCYKLAAQSLWFDELSTWWAVSQMSWLTGFKQLWVPQAGYPLYQLLLKMWISLLGQSEWALRSFSVLSGTWAVMIIIQIAHRLSLARSLVCGLVVIAPLPLWYAQESTAYSLFFCTAAMLLLTIIRLLETPTSLKLVQWIGAALICMSSHRLGSLLVIGCLVAGLLRWSQLNRLQGVNRPISRYWLRGAIVGLSFCTIGLIGYGVKIFRVDNPLVSQSHRQATLIDALEMTIWSFSSNQNPGDFSWLWLLPSLGLASWGLVKLLLDCRKHWQAQTLLCLMLVPIGLFAILLGWTKLYEPRYMIGLYPLWILILAYPSVNHPKKQNSSSPAALSLRQRVQASQTRLLYHSLTFGVIGVNLMMLIVPKTGLWSNNPVREQYREAIDYLAHQIHQDDIFMVHPGYLSLAWFYYAPRRSPDPLPHPLTFTEFDHYATTSAKIDAYLQTFGQQRSFLLVGPFHARTIDPPPSDQAYGIIGSFYQSGNGAWQPCGQRDFLGVAILCIAQPASNPTKISRSSYVPVTFGQHIVLHDYQIKPFAGKFNAGGSLPITLFWQYTQPFSEPHQLTLALRRVGTSELQAFEWGLLAQAEPRNHLSLDQRAIRLSDYRSGQPLAAGRYEIVLMIQKANIAPNTIWLTAQNANGISTNQVILTTIDVSNP
ncbi:hypothetical protein [Herpetosiphon sp. NSE202]|uniref:glycosyltransferase family 39 protein n=1 Tax=Herpetosiphon sp. NSE202 TaxID=3351349 RepID=UPI00363DE1B1